MNFDDDGNPGSDAFGYDPFSDCSFERARIRPPAYSLADGAPAPPGSPINNDPYNEDVLEELWPRENDDQVLAEAIAGALPPRVDRPGADNVPNAFAPPPRVRARTDAEAMEELENRIFGNLLGFNIHDEAGEMRAAPNVRLLTTSPVDRDHADARERIGKLREENEQRFVKYIRHRIFFLTIYQKKILM